MYGTGRSIIHNSSCNELILFSLATRVYDSSFCMCCSTTASGHVRCGLARTQKR